MPKVYCKISCGCKGYYILEESRMHVIKRGKNCGDNSPSYQLFESEFQHQIKDGSITIDVIKTLKETKKDKIDY